jgi:DNA-binding MarR family transcriptional regulator
MMRPPGEQQAQRHLITLSPPAVRTRSCELISLAATYPSDVPSVTSASSTASVAGAPQQTGPAGPALDAARLRVAVLRLSRRLRKHDLAGLTPSQLSTLSYVGKSGPVRLGDLAAAERIAPSTLTRVVNVLEERGYLRRQPAPDDARAFLVTVTDAGLSVLERIREEGTRMLADILRTLPPDELAALEAALPALEWLAGTD